MAPEELPDVAADVAIEVADVVPDVSAVVADNDSAVRAYLMSLKSARSLSTAEESLKRIATALDYRHPSEIPWSKLGLEELTALKNRLSNGGLSPATVNLTLSTVRQVLSFIALSSKPAHEI